MIIRHKLFLLTAMLLAAAVVLAGCADMSGVSLPTVAPPSGASPSAASTPAVITTVPATTAAATSESTTTTAATTAAVTTSETTTAAVPEKYFNTVAGAYFFTDGAVRLYHGYAEYGHQIQFTSREDTKNAVILTYSGQMTDGYGEEEGKPRVFTVVYTVDGNSVTERVSNADPLRERDNVLNSIIPGFIVLEGEIKTGGEWSQEFMLPDGGTYTAVTTITEATAEGFSTETVVRDIPGYTDNTYREVRGYKIGAGLVRFHNNALENEDELLGYTLSGYIDPTSGEFVQVNP